MGTFEEIRRENEILIQQKEIELKEIELRIKENELKKNNLISPTNATIIVALIGAIATGLINLFQLSKQKDIERQKFEYSIYQKAYETGDVKEAATILDFFIKAGLLSGENGKFSKLIEEGKEDEIPVDRRKYLYENTVLPTIFNGKSFKVENNFLIGRGTKYMLSSNANKRNNMDSLSIIVIHSSFSSDINSTTKFFSDTNTKVSYHILIDKDGNIIQLVPFNYISWHTGDYNYNQISIAIGLINEGNVTKNTNGNNLITLSGKEISSSSVECIGKNNCWVKFSDIQINTTYEICKLLIRKYHIKNIITHTEIKPNHICPGPLFPIRKFKSLIVR